MNSSGESGLSAAVALPVFFMGGASTFFALSRRSSFSGFFGGVLMSLAFLRKSGFSFGFGFSFTCSTASTLGCSIFSGSGGLIGLGSGLASSGFGGGLGSGSGSSVCSAHGGTIVMSMGMITSGARNMILATAQKKMNAARCRAKA